MYFKRLLKVKFDLDYFELSFAINFTLLKVCKETNINVLDHVFIPLKNIFIFTKYLKQNGKHSTSIFEVIG